MSTVAGKASIEKNDCPFQQTPPLNTGLFLQKKGESQYGMFRRFLIANNTYGLASISKRLTEQYENLHGALLVPHNKRCQMVQYLECNVIRIKGLSNKSTPSDVVKIKRNCPSCAQIGFHSDAHNCNWLLSCPVHKIPILDECPKCSSVWPTRSELMAKKCNVCGVKLSIQQLVKAGAFNDTNFEDFQFLTDCFKTHKQCSATELYGSFNKDSSGDDRNTIDIYDPYFPSVYQAAFPESRPCFERLGVSRYEVIERSFRLKKSGVNECGQVDFYTDWAETIQKKVIGRIVHMAQGELGSKYQLSLREHYDSNSPKSYRDLFSIAYTLWFHLVQQPTTHYLKRENLWGSDVYRLGSSTEIPSIPRPLQFIKKQMKDSIERSLPKEISYAIPPSVAKVLYELDLWVMFNCIFEYLNAYYHASLLGLKIIDFLAYLPHIAKPENAQTSSFGAYIYRDGSAKIVIPSDLFYRKVSLQSD